MSNVADDKRMVVYEADGTEIKLTPKIVQEYIVGEGNGLITLPEFKMFAELCKVRKLNPFLKEAYCIKYGNQPATIIVGKDAILKRAVTHPDFDGFESGIIVRDKETGELTERQGTFYLADSEDVVGGWAKVYRKNVKYPRYMSVPISETAQRKKDGALTSMWAGKTALMLEKTAKVRALRELFVEELGGMYEEEETDIPYKVIDVTPKESAAVQEDVTVQDEPLSGEKAENIKSLDDF